MLKGVFYMNKTLKFLFTLSMLASLPTICATKACDSNCGSSCGNSCNDNCACDCTNIGECDAYPFLQMRSQGRDAARQLVGVQEFVNKYGADSTNTMFSVAAEYSQSFQNERLSHFLFGNDLVDCCNLYVQGSDVANRNPKAWLADYFGLPTDYSSKVSFCPKIQNAIVDLDLYVGLDGWAEGLYFRVDAPIAWTKWQLCPSEAKCDAGVLDTAAGYMSSTTIARADLPSSFVQAMSGCSTFGDMTTAMKYGRFNSSCDCSTEAGLAELSLRLGWNFHLEEDHHFGAFLYASAPTGTRPCAKNLFEPIIGNGKHWELGGGVTGSWIFWRSEEHDSRYVGFWLDATIATLLKADQCRSFDFKCKPNSRYMLLEEMTTNTALTGAASTYTASDYQYASNLIPAINWSTFSVDVSIPVQGDIALKLGGVRENWSFDLGYNLWARTGEKFCNDCCSSCATDKTYAIKGDATLYGRYNAINSGDPAYAGNHTVAIAQTESAATIHGPALVNSLPTADNLQQAHYGTAHDYVFSLVTTNTLQTSIQPVLVTKSMLDLGRSPSSITHKIFTNINYSWKDREGRWTPFLGLGGNVEFSQDNYNDCCCCDSNSCNSCATSSCNSCTTNTCATNSCNNSCNSCDCNSPRGAVSIWGVWIKGGVAFN